MERQVVKNDHEFYDQIVNPFIIFRKYFPQVVKHYTVERFQLTRVTFVTVQQ